MARVENVRFGRPEEYPSKEPVHLTDPGCGRVSYTAVLSKYGKRKGLRVENRYELELYENYSRRQSGSEKTTLLASFRFGSEDRLEVITLWSLRGIINNCPRSVS